MEYGFDHKAFGKRIQNALKKRGVTAEELARTIGVTPKTVKNYLEGITEPSTPTFVKLCRALRVRLNDLLEEGGEFD